MSGIQCELYRFYNDDGSSKDWAIGYQMGSSSSSENKLVVFFGKTNNKYQIRTVRTFYGPPGMNEEREKEKRIQEQVKQGYDYIASPVIDAESKKVLSSQSQSKSEIIAKRPLLYWSNAAAFKSNHDVKVVNTCIIQAAENAAQILNFNKSVRDNSEGFILNDDSGLSLEFGANSVNGFNQSGVGYGEIHKEHGVKPFLLLLHVIKALRKLSSVSVSHLLFAEEHNPTALEVHEFRDLESILHLIELDFQEPEIRILAEKLELVEPMINFAAISDDSLANEFF